jgi:chromosome partitioning protein
MGVVFMAEVVAFALQKGGTGKTTSIAQTAYILAETGKKVAIFDLDPQGNLALAYGIDPDTLPLTIIDVIMGDCEPNKICINKFGVDLYPSNDWLSRFELLLITKPKRFPEPWTVMKKIIDSIRDDYDYILIDLPPSLGVLTTNGLLAANSLIIIMQTEFFALSGLRNMINNLNTFIIPIFKHNIKVLGILPTMFDHRLNLNVTVLENVKNTFINTEYRVLTPIPRATKFGFAPTKGKLAVEMYKDDKVIQSYRTFVKEVFGIG